MSVKLLWYIFHKILGNINKLMHYCPHSTEIFRKYCGIISFKYGNFDKIFWNLSTILFKCCSNFAVSAYNITCVTFEECSEQHCYNIVHQ